MALMTLEQFDFSNHQPIDHYQIKGFEVHSDLVAGMLTNKTKEKIGVVTDILIDDAGQIQYIAVDLATRGSGKTVLLPIDRVRIDQDKQQVYASGMTREQAEFLPVFDPQTLRHQSN